MAMAHKVVHTYADLLQQIRSDLRAQHPEWIEPSGESPMVDSYEARLMELLAAQLGSGRDEAAAIPERATKPNRNRLLKRWLHSPGM
jgi:hypothetical protein